MNVLIVEDEELAAERLEILINRCDSTVKILDCIDTVKDTVSFIQQHEKAIDLIFLDIQLADGKSFEIFSKVKVYIPIIFVTAYDEYTLSAFKLNSIDYLLKPINYEELEAALEKFKKIQDQNSPTLIDKQLINSILSENNRRFKKRFLVKLGQRIQFKSADEIGYIFADDKICHIVEKITAKKYMIDHTLEELDDGLLDPEIFFRINRKFIININSISEIKSYYNNRLEVKLNIPSEESMIVSRNKVKQFKNWLNS